MDGENVGFLNRLRVDSLMRLDMRKRCQTIPVNGCMFKVEIGGSGLHRCCQMVFHRLAFSGQERLGFAHEFGIVLVADFMCAGGGTALDLIEKAGTCPCFKDRIGAGPQKKGTLESIDRAAYGTSGSKRTEIIALAGSCAAMFEDARCPVIAGQKNVRKRLIVAQQHVEARTQSLDKIGLEQQSFGFCAGNDEFHHRRLTDHPHNAIRMGYAARIIGDAFLEIARLADIEHIAIAVEHAIDAGTIGQAFYESVDDSLSAQPFDIRQAIRRIPLDGIGSRWRHRGFNDILVLVILFGFRVTNDNAGHILCVVRRQICDSIIIVLAVSSHSVIPAISGVSHARCCPPSSAIIWPVMERFSQK